MQILENTNNDQKIIDQTKAWITNVVIGCNFCPFAAAVVMKKDIAYRVLQSDSKLKIADEMNTLMNSIRIDKTETAFLILDDQTLSFNSFLQIVRECDRMIRKKKYEGMFQLATFHPEYLFAGSDENDPANYTNRSPYPMLQVLREKSITDALKKYKDPERIPEKNIAYANQKGLAFMQDILAACRR